MSRMPGIEFLGRGPRAAAAPLRSDVAAFLGRTRRGPIGEPVRVEGWRRFLREFGDLSRDLTLPYAVRGYFANGGQVAYVVRLAGRDNVWAQTTWDVSNLIKTPEDAGPQRARPVQRYRVKASSPGGWAADTEVQVHANRFGLNGQTQVDLTIRTEGEATEYIANLLPQVTQQQEDEGRALTMASRVLAESALIRLEALVEPLAPGASQPIRSRRFDEPLVLQGAKESDQPTVAEYLGALALLGDQPEPAILAAPALAEDFMEGAERQEIVSALVRLAAQTQDRMVVLDAPPAQPGAPSTPLDTEGVLDFANLLRKWVEVDGERRSAALYHPWLWVLDPLGGAVEPLRRLPPSGHVAGVISRLDRDRGAHHTPANAPVLEAVDIDSSFDSTASGLLNDAGVNLIRCQPGRGLLIWGGRTLDPQSGGRFLAHRRLIHRLVRVIRRVAEPIVFEKNGPELWLALVRAVTSVLLEVYRSGALKGNRPEQAFQVRCDETTNPPEQQELGRAVCEIAVAPAVPMEFITLRVALSESGQLEVFEA